VETSSEEEDEDHAVHPLHPSQPGRKAKDNKLIAYVSKMLTTLSKVAVIHGTTRKKGGI
jgi:hypothetical protein